MLPSYTVLRNKTVKISCAWENGNPLTKVHLLDGYGTILNMSEVNNITYIFPSASCDNSGIIRCEAPGSNRNASFTFLVQCNIAKIHLHFFFFKIVFNPDRNVSLPLILTFLQSYHFKYHRAQCALEFHYLLELILIFLQHIYPKLLFISSYEICTCVRAIGW